MRHYSIESEESTDRCSHSRMYIHIAEYRYLKNYFLLPILCLLRLADYFIRASLGGGSREELFSVYCQADFEDPSQSSDVQSTAKKATL
jgi:hypothetical protein